MTRRDSNHLSSGSKFFAHSCDCHFSDSLDFQYVKTCDICPFPALPRTPALQKGPTRAILLQSPWPWCQSTMYGPPLKLPFQCLMSSSCGVFLFFARRWVLLLLYFTLLTRRLSFCVHWLILFCSVRCSSAKSRAALYVRGLDKRCLSHVVAHTTSDHPITMIRFTTSNIISCVSNLLKADVLGFRDLSLSTVAVIFCALNCLQVVCG